MDRVIYTAMSGAKGLLDQQAALANNLANVSSTGFRAELHRLRAVAVQSEALPTRSFAVDASVASDLSPGALAQTGRPLDVAIEGKGWLVVRMPDGSEAYTRDGSLELDAEGVLRTRRGLPVLGEGDVISLPPSVQLSIGSDGSISAINPEQPAVVVNLAQLRRVNPPEESLLRGGDGLFRLRNGGQAEPDPNVRIRSAYLEGSNVNSFDTMVQMISSGRQFEMQMRMLDSAHQNERAAAKLLAVA